MSEGEADKVEVSYRPPKEMHVRSERIAGMEMGEPVGYNEDGELVRFTDEDNVAGRPIGTFVRQVEPGVGAWSPFI